jgi:hypothetical protein
MSALHLELAGLFQPGGRLNVFLDVTPAIESNAVKAMWVNRNCSWSFVKDRLL